MFDLLKIQKIDEILCKIAYLRKSTCYYRAEMCYFQQIICLFCVFNHFYISKLPLLICSDSQLKKNSSSLTKIKYRNRTVFIKRGNKLSIIAKSTSCKVSKSKTSNMFPNSGPSDAKKHRNELLLSLFSRSEPSNETQITL